MILSDYKHKRKVKILLEEGSKLVKLFQEMETQLTPYSKFAAAKDVMANLQQNEVFLRLTLKKLKEENDEKG